ncbi:MAG: SOS response-associated peptidase [Pseudomonadota bacterium]
MAGRYFLFSPPDVVAAHFGLAAIGDFPPRYNIAPTQPVGVVRGGRDGPEFVLMRWGFLPAFAKEISGRPLINARAETVAEKPSFRAAFRRRRCLVPADGFYDWTLDDDRTPHAVRPRAGGLVGFAGIWEDWMGPDGSELSACAILTVNSGPDTEHLHLREPAVIAPEDYALWLHADETMVEAVRPLPRPSVAEFWDVYEVSRDVGAVRNDHSTLIAPAAKQTDLF